MERAGSSIGKNACRYKKKKNDMLDVQRRRTEEEVERGREKEKRRGTNRYRGEKTQKQKMRTKPSGKT